MLDAGAGAITFNFVIEPNRRLIFLRFILTPWLLFVFKQVCVLTQGATLRAMSAV